MFCICRHDFLKQNSSYIVCKKKHFKDQIFENHSSLDSDLTKKVRVYSEESKVTMQGKKNGSR